MSVFQYGVEYFVDEEGTFVGKVVSGLPEDATWVVMSTGSSLGDLQGQMVEALEAAVGDEAVTGVAIEFFEKFQAA